MIYRRFVFVAACLVSAACFGQGTQPQTFSKALEQVMAEPVFQHASFGVEFYSLDTHAPVFSYNGQKLFTPGSTTKLLTEGTALELLGADYRFHTFAYRIGDVDSHGTLKGNLVLVASGDPNLSGRANKDGTLAFKDEDHSYGGPDAEVVAGDPLVVLREFADQIAAHGIKKVEGQVLIDATLFNAGVRELGTGVFISPICVNDNVIDVIVTPGHAFGDAATISVSPVVPGFRFVNQVTTSASTEKPDLDRHAKKEADGSMTITLSGKIPAGSKPYLAPYPVPDPVQFAQVLLTQVLTEHGIEVKAPSHPAAVDFATLKTSYTAANQVAEHVSLPLSEEIKVTLKVSQNLHASMTPYTLGAVLGHVADDADAKGFSLEHDFLEKAGLDLAEASQADGAGGAASAFYTPDFMVHYLAYMAQQPTADVFHRALPILGRDGTLVKIQVDNPAAGHVFAKTGTYGAMDLLNNNLMLVGKGLAGYLTTNSGQHLCFALYVNHVSLPRDPDAVQETAGQALGAIAAAAWALPFDKPALDAAGNGR